MRGMANYRIGDRCYRRAGSASAYTGLVGYVGLGLGLELVLGLGSGLVIQWLLVSDAVSSHILL